MPQLAKSKATQPLPFSKQPFIHTNWPHFDTGFDNSLVIPLVETVPNGTCGMTFLTPTLTCPILEQPRANLEQPRATSSGSGSMSRSWSGSRCLKLPAGLTAELLTRYHASEYSCSMLAAVVDGASVATKHEPIPELTRHHASECS